MAKPFTLRLEVDIDSDNVTLDDMTRQLLRELKDIDVESVTLTKENIFQEGAKAVDPVTVGALIVVVLPAILPQLINFLRDWAGRANNRTVKIKRQQKDRSIEVEYDVKNISEEEIKQMLGVLSEFIQNDN